MRLKLLLIATVVVLLHSSFRKGQKAISMVGKEITPFVLPGVDGRQHGLSDFPEAKGYIVIFTCNHCPFARLYTDRFNALAARYSGLGVPVLAINPMDTLAYASETFDEMKRFAAEKAYHFPYLQDADQQIARRFGAAHTPQAYVLWQEDGKWIVRYQGAIDGNGQHPEQAKPFVAMVVDSLLIGAQPPFTEQLSLGCAINYRK